MIRVRHHYGMSQTNCNDIVYCDIIKWTPSERILVNVQHSVQEEE